VRVRLRACACARTHTHARGHTHTHMCVQVHTCVRPHACICMHSRVHSSASAEVAPGYLPGAFPGPPLRSQDALGPRIFRKYYSATSRTSNRKASNDHENHGATCTTSVRSPQHRPPCSGSVQATHTHFTGTYVAQHKYATTTTYAASTRLISQRIVYSFTHAVLSKVRFLHVVHQRSLKGPKDMCPITSSALNSLAFATFPQ
jgi:hypothetical protein